MSHDQRTAGTFEKGREKGHMKGRRAGRLQFVLAEAEEGKFTQLHRGQSSEGVRLFCDTVQPSELRAARGEDNTLVS